LHISPYFRIIYKFPFLRPIYVFLLNLHFWLPAYILTMMHLCIMLYAYWLLLKNFDFSNFKMWACCYKVSK